MKGELIALSVALNWTITALFAEIVSKRVSPLGLNILRMSMSIILLSLMLWVFTGVPYPTGASTEAWFWLGLSGVVGYVFGDMCLMTTYVLIGSRFGQLFMTLAPAAAAIFGNILLGEKMPLQAICGMIITMSGIAISVLNKGEGSKLKIKLPLKGVLFGIGAGLGQGVGLVLSKVGMTYYSDPAKARKWLIFCPLRAPLSAVLLGLSALR